MAVKRLLQTYEASSGQAINNQKSGIFFSSNVRLDKQQELKTILEVSNDLKDSRYLGLPSLIGRKRKTVFNYIKEKVWKKVQDLNHKNLSKAGKTVMVKNVAQSIPSYSMSCFLLPKSLCLEIEKMMNGYWWGLNKNKSKGIRWLAWNKMVVLKCKGALVFETYMVSIWHCWGNMSGSFVTITLPW